jgi:hypothetical protein
MGRPQETQRIIFKDYPIAFWFTGLMFIGVVIVPSETFWRAVFTLIGAAIIAFAPVLIVASERSRSVTARYCAFQRTNISSTTSGQSMSARMGRTSGCLASS